MSGPVDPGRWLAGDGLGEKKTTRRAASLARFDRCENRLLTNNQAAGIARQAATGGGDAEEKRRAGERDDYPDRAVGGGRGGLLIAGCRLPMCGWF